MGCHEEAFELTPYVVENFDWGNWNMQVSSITVASSESPSFRAEIWEDQVLVFRPFVHPMMSELTFGGVIRRKSMFLGDQEVNLDLLSKTIRELRAYNKAWIGLLNGFTSAAPIDLSHALYTHLAGVDSLDELFPDEERYK